MAAKVKEFIKEANSHELFLPLKIDRHFVQAITPAHMLDKLVHRDRVIPVPSPKRCQSPTVKILNTLQLSNDALWSLVANSIPVTRDDTLPWANSMLNFYTGGIYSKVMSSLDKHSDMAHHWQRIHPTTGVSYTIDVCTTLKKYKLRGFVGHHKLRIKPFFTTEFYKADVAGTPFDAIRSLENYDGRVDNVDPVIHVFIKLTVEFILFSPQDDDEEEKKEEEEMIELDEDDSKEKQKVGELFENVYTVHYVLPIFDRGTMGSVHLFGPVFRFRRPIDLASVSQGYPDEIEQILVKEAISRESANSDPMVKKVAKMQKEDRFYAKMKKK